MGIKKTINTKVFFIRIQFTFVRVRKIVVVLCHSFLFVYVFSNKLSKEGGWFYWNQFKLGVSWDQWSQWSAGKEEPLNSQLVSDWLQLDTTVFSHWQSSESVLLSDRVSRVPTTPVQDPKESPVIQDSQ